MTSLEAQRQLASLPVAVLLLAPGQRISSVNPAAEQVLGQSVRRLAGRHLLDTLSFQNAGLSSRLTESETPVSAREVDVAISGMGTRRLDITSAPLLDQPGWQVVTLHDSSVAELMGEDHGEFGDAVLRAPEILAHEIKNPLAGIRGAAQLLARRAKGNDLALTGLIADEVDRIAKLIDQMQSLSRKTIAPLAPCNLHEAIRRAIAVLGAAGTGSAWFHEEFDPSLPPVLGDPDALVQILINLLANCA